MKGRSISLDFILGVVLKNIVWIIIAAVIGGILGYTYTSKTQTTSYTATVKFVAFPDRALYEEDPENPDGGSDGIELESVSQIAYAMRLISTYMHILDSRGAGTIIAQTIKDNNGYKDSMPAPPAEAEPENISFDWLNYIGAGTVTSAVVLSNYEDTNIFQASITTTNYYLTEAICHGYEDAAATAINELYDVGTVKVFERSAAPYYTPVDYKMPTVVFALAFAVLAAAFFIFINYLDDSIRTEADLASYGVLFLGGVPEINPNDKNEVNSAYSGYGTVKKKRKKTRS